MVQRRPDHPSQTHGPEASGETRGGGEGKVLLPRRNPGGPALVGEVPSEPSVLHLAPAQVLKVELENLRFH